MAEDGGQQKKEKEKEKQQQKKTSSDPLLLPGDSSLAPGTNLGSLWISRMSSHYPNPSSSSSSSSIVIESPYLFHSLLSRDLSLDLPRSRPRHLVFRLLVPQSIANRYNTLHGGAIGALIEILGCFAIRSASGNKEGGTVTDINISYISGSAIKDEVEFEAKVLKLGENNAVASVDVCNKTSGKVAAQGRVTMCFDSTSKL